MTKQKMMMILFGGAMMMQAACILGGEPEPEPWTPVEPEPEPPVMQQLAELDAVYISGHLGNYSSCPEKGYTEGGGTSTGGAPERGEPSADFAPGACAEPAPGEDVGDDYCGGGGLWNCEEAQITLELSNLSADVNAQNVSVKSIEVLDDSNMVRAVLPVNAVVVIDDQSDFDGALDTSESVKVRVDYKGPVNLYDILSEEGADSSGRGFYHHSVKLRITVGAENADDVIVNTKAVQQIPDVAT